MGCKKMFSSSRLLSSSGWATNQIDMRQINRRTCPCLLQCPCKGALRLRPQDALGSWGFCISFWTKEKRAGVWIPKEKQAVHGQTRESKHVPSKSLLGHPETMGPRREVNKQAWLDFSPSDTFYIMKLSWCSLPVSRFFRLSSFRQVMGEGQSFFPSLLFLNNQLNINTPKSVFWGSKPLVPLNNTVHLQIDIYEQPLKMKQLLLQICWVTSEIYTVFKWRKSSAKQCVPVRIIYPCKYIEKCVHEVGQLSSRTFHHECAWT